MIKVNWQDDLLNTIQELVIKEVLTKQEIVNLSLSIMNGVECSDQKVGHCPVSSNIRIETGKWFMCVNREYEFERKLKD